MSTHPASSTPNIPPHMVRPVQGHLQSTTTTAGAQESLAILEVATHGKEGEWFMVSDEDNPSNAEGVRLLIENKGGTLGQLRPYRGVHYHNREVQYPPKKNIERNKKNLGVLTLTPSQVYGIILQVTSWAWRPFKSRGAEPTPPPPQKKKTNKQQAGKVRP